MARLALIPFALAIAGCEGFFAVPPAAPAPPAVVVTPPPVEVLPQPVARLHLLTAAQFAGSVRALLGNDVPLSPVEPDVDSEGFASVGASQRAVSPAGVEAYEKALGEATAYVFAAPARITAALGCTPTGLDDATCLQAALRSFGRRAFRRPLTQAELERFTALVQELGADSTVREGLRSAVWAMLQSPAFLYRAELGEVSPDGRRAYTGEEMASRLSATLWASAPDDALLDAAAAGELSTREGVRAQAQRMLEAPRARAAFSGWIDDLYNTEHLRSALKDTALFPSWDEALREAMHEELRLRVDDLVFTQRGDFLSLYDARSTFVNDRLAAHYGLTVAPGPGFRQVQLPEASRRRGLLGGGALLAANALPQRTSPTQRGRFVAEVLLCKVVPPPPPTVVTTIEGSADAGTSLRAQLEEHRKSPSCSGCHALMDPIGLGLEEFDSVAVARSTERGAPIDASGALDGVAFANGAELATRVREHPAAGPCFVQKLYTSAQGRAVMKADAAALQALAGAFAASGHRADLALLELVSSEAFRFVEPSAPAVKP